MLTKGREKFTISYSKLIYVRANIVFSSLRFSLSFHCPFFISLTSPHHTLPRPLPPSTTPGTFPLQIFRDTRTARVRVYAQLFRSVKGFDGGSTFRPGVRDTRLPARSSLRGGRRPLFYAIIFFYSFPLFFSHSLISPSSCPSPYVLVSISTIVYPTSPSRAHVSLALSRRPLLSRLVKPTRQIIPSPSTACPPTALRR